MWRKDARTEGAVQSKKREFSNGVGIENLIRPQIVTSGFSKTEFDLRTYRNKLAPDKSQLEKKDQTMNKDSSSRRSFLKTASVAATALTLIPRHVLGQGQTPPSQKLNIAGIGVGGMGSGDVASCAQAGENIVALCDPDRNHLADNAKKYPAPSSTRIFAKCSRHRRTLTQ